MAAKSLTASDGDGAEGGGIRVSYASRVEQGQRLEKGEWLSGVIGEQMQLHGLVGVAEHQNVGLLFQGAIGRRKKTALDVVGVSVHQKNSHAIYGDQLLGLRFGDTAAYDERSRPVTVP